MQRMKWNKDLKECIITAVDRLERLELTMKDRNKDRSIPISRNHTNSGANVEINAHGVNQYIKKGRSMRERSFKQLST